MPQETNLNVSPYFDDFDPNKNFYKVLFKPGYPIQARELTTLQSILQNQIEKFGNHIFKEGSLVIPGRINYTNQLFCVNIQRNYLGTDIGSYVPYLLNRVIRGQRSNVKAKIFYTLTPEETNRDTYTFYINYLSEGVGDQRTFIENEPLILEEDGVIDTRLPFQIGQQLAVTATEDVISIGSGVFLSEGVYFIRGHFVRVPAQTLIIDSHGTSPTTRVGLEIREDIISSSQDSSLNDNARGFNNYAAPGADRLRITAVLSQRSLDTDRHENFIELLVIRGGEVSRLQDNTVYNQMAVELARRTYDQSGDFYVKPFIVTTHESLNDNKGNNGIFLQGQRTYSGREPDESLGVYKISPGKAYVKGYEVNNPHVNYLDFEKTRETNTLQKQLINYFTGPSIKLNRVSGFPKIGFTTSTISLRNSRVGINSNLPSGQEIGIARIYDYQLDSDYSTSNSNLNEWNISLYDIQTYSVITLNESVSLTTPTYIVGKASGATGHLRYDSSSGIITAYNVKGNFLVGEKFSFNGIENTRVSTAVTSYGVNDVKSVYNLVGSGVSFNADTVLYDTLYFDSVTISPKSGSAPGISTVTSNGIEFNNRVKPGDIVSFTNPLLGSTLVKTFAKVEKITGDYSIIISGINTVTDINDGGLPNSSINPSDFTLLNCFFEPSSDNTLYTPLPKKYVSNVDLTNSSLVIKKEFDVTITSNSSNIIQADANEAFLTFTESRYALSLNDGTNIPLSRDKFTFLSNNSQIQLNGLNISSGSARLIATLKKSNVSNKIKNKTRVNSIIVNKSQYSKSGIGSTTFDDGLAYGNYGYGLRVQDKDICLLKPDVTRVYGVFESLNTDDPILPKLILTELTGVNGRVSDTLIGDEIYGNTSGARAISVEQIGLDTIGFVYLNDLRFVTGELLTFVESKVGAKIQSFTEGSPNIIDRYNLDSGQLDTICDYSRLIRKDNSKEPRRKLRVIFENGSYLPTDTGDITTVSSYNQFDYCILPQVSGNIKVSDIIDIRPRVADFDVSNQSVSPFEFNGRTFTTYSNSSKYILASNDNIELTYSYYLGRIDKIFVSTDGTFQSVKGVAAENPVPPLVVDDSLEIATITIPPYLCNAAGCSIKLNEYKRYRMSDIALLEQRIQKLEYYTALSLLEKSTENLHIPDERGLNRYKSGIFVDNFEDRKNQINVGSVKNSIDKRTKELRAAPFTTSIDLLLGSSEIIAGNPQEDVKFSNNLIGSGVRRTGQLLTLDYNEVPAYRQGFATRIENVTPYLVTDYIGSIDLFPASDIWIDQVTMSARSFVADNYTPTRNQLIATGWDPQTGLSPTMWSEWVLGEWVGQPKVTEQTYVTGVNIEMTDEGLALTTTSQTTTKTTQDRLRTRTGTKARLGDETTPPQSEGSFVTGTEVIPYMRSRNLEFTGKKFKPLTRLYAFFDGVDVNRFIVPKLLEIRMISGSFTVGEIVSGTMTTGTETESETPSTPSIKFRVAQSNHRTGSISNPSDIYITSPYDRNYTIPETYSSSSILLNVDTSSLASMSEGLTSGFVQVGMRIRGQSGEAVITDVKLVSDNVGSIIGAFFIPDPNIPTNPRFETGTKVFRLTNNQTNSSIGGFVNSGGEEQFFAQGSRAQNTEVIRSTRIATFTPVNVEPQTETLYNQEIGQSVAPAPAGGGVAAIPLPPPPDPGPPPPPGNPVPIVSPPAQTTSTPTPRVFTPFSDVVVRPVINTPTVTPIKTNPPQPKSNIVILGFPGGSDHTNGYVAARPAITVLANGTSRPATPKEINQAKTTLNKDLFSVGANNLFGGTVALPSFYKNNTPVQVKSAQSAVRSGGGLQVPVPARNPPPPPPPPPSNNGRGNSGGNRGGCGRRDPLAQSFYVAEEGRFVTSVDVYFRTKDPLIPVMLELRTMINGYPSSIVYPFSRVVLEPSQVVESYDGSEPTRFTFPSPVWLENGEHAIVLLSDSNEYTVWISRLGELDVSTANLPESRQIVVSNQTVLGSLFKSQNASTWTPSQYEDLKYTIYCADFVESTGDVVFYNPELSGANNQIARLRNDSLDFKSKKIKITLSDVVNTTGLNLGNTIIQTNTDARADYVGAGGSASGTLNIINAGIGYTPSNGTSYTFTNVQLTSLTGEGKNATANITIGSSAGVNGVAIAATIVSGGSGYSVGDVLTATQIGNLSLGRNLQLSLTAISGVNELELDQVQGEFEISGVKDIRYINSLGISTSLFTLSSAAVYPSDIQTFSTDQDGLHIKVNHRNHGMHDVRNKVILSNITSDVIPTKLTLDYLGSDSGPISIASTEYFSTFENVSVGATNPGYIKIENEIISYTGIVDGQLIGITRGIDQTNSYTYPAGTGVTKYELNNVSLRRINKTHDLQDSTVLNSIGLDYYHVKLDMSSNGIDRTSGIGFPKLFIGETKSCGGRRVRATQNIQFEIARPIVEALILPGTTITAEMKTISGTSISGSEPSFVEQDLTPISLNNNTYFTEPRLIASRVNEVNNLISSPGFKSLALNFNLSSNTSIKSPVIDLDRVGLALISNRVNSVITDYATDGRTSSLIEDPTAFSYASNVVELENSATSLKVILSAYVSVFSEIRAFYSVSNSLENELIYYPFPGYTNLDVNKNIINFSNNNGLPDKLVPKDTELRLDHGHLSYAEYEFSIDRLPSFRYFSIKLIGTSTNQAYPPRIREFRTIALA